MKKTLLVGLVFINLLAVGRDVRVRLFSSYKLSSAWISTKAGDYFIIATDKDFNPIDTILDIYGEQKLRTLFIEEKNSDVSIKMGGENFGAYNGILIHSKDQGAYFNISGKGPERVYEGHLMIRSHSSQLQIINEIELESYVAGVVESEGGHNQEYEYYKAQAILARTWVIKNWNKHIDEGYNVMDNTSSQVYKSKAYYTHHEQILKAVKETKDTILIDKKGQPVMGAFFSNSGGQTANSEDVWSRKIEYLRSVQDSFSLQGKHATWTKNIDKKKFIGFFAFKMDISATDEAFESAILSIQQKERVPYFIYGDKKLKMRYVRNKFKLKSTFFSVEENGEEVILHGKGYGHGVGLSQEGAMVMAKKGYNYKEILSYYFVGIKYQKLSNMK